MELTRCWIHLRHELSKVASVQNRHEYYKENGRMLSKRPPDYDIYSNCLFVVLHTRLARLLFDQFQVDILEFPSNLLDSNLYRQPLNRTSTIESMKALDPF